MGLFDMIRGEFIDIIEWLDDSRDTIAWRFPRHDNEIKMGAKLIVREGQLAVFVNEGRIADVFAPGTYTLTTQNLPVLSTLQGWKYGFNSPFKAEVYFFNTRQFTDLKWGTQNPIIVRDPEFGMVRLRAFGGFALRVVDPPLLLQELVGTDPQFRTEEVAEHLRQRIVSHLAPAFANSGMSVLDMAANQQALGDRLAQALSAEFASIGVAIPRFIIENISLPPEVEAALDKRAQMGIVGNLDQYTKFQAATAMERAADNPDGAMGSGMGIGMGMAMGQQMAAAFQPGAQQSAAPAGPPPLPQEQWYLAVNGQQQGPFPTAALHSHVANGTLTPDTLVWKNGMAQWTPARQVPELAPFFTPQGPPPLPPQ